MNGPIRITALVLVGLTTATAVALLGGAQCVFRPVNVDGCAVENPDAAINVAGTFRYSGGGGNEQGQQFVLSGTITFEQDGNRVRVSDTTYDFSGNRRVAGEFTELQGNRLTTVLTPINGDTDYTADVTFIFAEDGNTFCVEFMDTNGDMGDLGSFVGTREP